MLEKSDSSVGEVLALFNETGLDVGLLVPTPTGLAKSIMDATATFRDFLVDADIHDFSRQEQGQDNKVVVPARMIFANGSKSTKVSLYRPNTKKGDPRVCVYGLKALYDPTRLCVADGVDQLVRGARADWRKGLTRDKRSTLPLGKCLRLKRNLSLFVSELARQTGSAWDAAPNAEAGGGRVIICTKPYADMRSLHKRLVEDLRSDGNDCVDMLVCVPPPRHAMPRHALPMPQPCLSKERAI